MNARTNTSAALFSLMLAASTASISLQAAPGRLNIDSFRNVGGSEFSVQSQSASADNRLAMMKSEDRPGLNRPAEVTNAPDNRLVHASAW